MFRYGLAALAAAVLVLACTARPAERSDMPTQQQRQLLPLQASYSAQVLSQVPIAIAKAAGYFEEQGLDVTLAAVRLGAQNTAALVSGEIDLSVLGGTAPLRARLGGADLRLIASTKPYFAGAIVAGPEITSPADLRGKRLGIGSKGGNPDLMARAVLPRFGIEPDRDVAFLNTGGALETVAALVAGSVDAGSVIPPADYQARNLGFHMVIDVTAARIPFLAVVLGTASSTISSRPEALERFVRAYAQAVHRYMTDKDFTLQVAAEFSPTDDPVANEQAYELERSIMQTDLDVPLAAVRASLDLMKAEDPRVADAQPEEFVDLRFVQRLKESGFLDRLYGGNAGR